MSVPDGLEVFGSMPMRDAFAWKDYMTAVDGVVAQTEAVGGRGILIYTDNSQLDPWILSQYVLAHSRILSPLVALQPACMHPHTAAKIIASLSFLHQRPIYLNLVAGGFKKELEALGDTTPHDER